MKKCIINYVRVYGEKKQDKFDWLSYYKGLRFKDIPFESIIPDKNNNWINLTDNDWDSLINLYSKDEFSLFFKSSIGVNTARDEWVFDFDNNALSSKIKYFINKYNELLAIDIKEAFNNLSNKRSEQLKRNFYQKKSIEFQNDKIIKSIYRPFINKFFYSEKLLNDRLTDSQIICYGENFEIPNLVLCISDSDRIEFNLLVVSKLQTFQFFMDPAKCLPLYRYDSKGKRIENITDWGLEQFSNRYEGIANSNIDEENTNTQKPRPITKEDIFHYVYAVLHNPDYRKKYEMNLKREFPRIPFFEDFWKWAEWGQKLIDLHINFETVEPYPLKIIESELQNEVNKPKLKAKKDTNEIILDSKTTLFGIPKEAWNYKLGNRSAIEWILDQYKEKKIKDSTIAEKFNTYRFADYKENVIDLIMRVTTVSVETVKIIKEMEELESSK